MQYSDIQARAQALASFEGWTDVSPAPDWPTLVNRAWAQFSYDAEIIVTTVTPSTVIGQASYTLTGGPWKKILDVTWNSLSVIRSMEIFERNLNPAWLVQANAAPQRWVLTNFGVLTLVPPPNAIQTLSVRGITEGPAMVLSTDQPGQVSGSGIAIPDVFHDAIAYRATKLHGEIYAQGESVNRIAGYEQRYQELVRKAREAMNGTGRSTMDPQPEAFGPPQGGG